MSADRLPGNAPEFTVSELSQALKRTLEESFAFVRVRGEISGYRGPASSGHAYFGLKDEGARLDAVAWRGVLQKLRFKPEEGLEVVVTGRITTYPGRSVYQIVIETLEPAGAGALMALLEQRRRTLTAEGLFETARKKKLPFLPDVIGVVTSPTGAVIRDILHRLADRFPRHVLVWPVLVQGERAAGEVAAAIEGFNRLPPGGAIPRPDVLIVARGGGSIEDLWPFNEEIVVRAAAASAVPLISAIGHETDWTLIDLAADVRAPTPTAAAELVVPVRAEQLARVEALSARLLASGARGIEHRRQTVQGLARALPRPVDLLALAGQRLDGAGERLRAGLAALLRRQDVRFAALAAKLSPRMLRSDVERHGERLASLMGRARTAVAHRASRLQERLTGLASLLAAVSHEAVLERGFVLVHAKDGSLLRRRAAAQPGEPVEIEFRDGRLPATLGSGTPPAKTSKKPDARETGGDKTAPGRQGRLF